jgi:trans-aconitate methyltransferase
MAKPTHVRSFVSNSREYHDAFKVFLDHTDQKSNALRWLERQLEGLRRRDVLLDVGAGNGKLTAWMAPHFGRVVAIEPSPSLFEELRTALPTVASACARIMDFEPEQPADFILCSHVFYYVDRREWAQNLERLASWLAPGGVAAIAIQNPETDCMRMIRHFTGRRLDLGELLPVVASIGRSFRARLETVEAHVTTRDFESACVIAEFMLNVLPMADPPPFADFERYVATHFRAPAGGFRFSCHQDFLRVERE